MDVIDSLVAIEEPWIAENLKPLLFVRKPVYYIPTTSITKSEDGIFLIGQQDQKDVARIPVANICFSTDSVRQMIVECHTVSIIFSKRVTIS
jgi:hypothetical protein